MDEPNVNDLLLAVRDGDDGAFALLLERYSPLINKLVLSFSGNQRFTEGELRSDAYAALHRASLSYDVSQVNVSFGLYARICVYNALKDTVSRSRSVGGELDVEKVAISSGIQHRLEKEESIKALKILAKDVLSEYEHQVFSLTLLGLKTADIAQKLSKSPKSVDNAKARMLKALREHLDMLFKT